MFQNLNGFLRMRPVFFRIELTLLSSFFGSGVGFGCAVAAVLLVVVGFFAAGLVSAGVGSGATDGFSSDVGCSTGGAGSAASTGAGLEMLVAFTGAGAVRRVET